MTRTTNPESILARLRNLQRERYPGIQPGNMLQLYGQQGLLARLDASPYAEAMVLKGALSLFARYNSAARPTQDIDLAARNMPNTPEQIRQVMETLCAVPFGDGLIFDSASVTVELSQAQFDYPGVKVQVWATLGSSRVSLQIDFSFGNVITPEPVQLSFPPLLLDERVRVAVYPLETVITEKFAALVEIGEATTRMKDLYDLHAILTQETFDAQTMSTALRASFTARKTPLEQIPVVLGDEFAVDAVLAARWQQYRRQQRLTAPGPNFTEIMSLLRRFYGPLLLEHRGAGSWFAGAWHEPQG